MKNTFEVKTNAKTHLVVQSDTGRCLGGIGANFYRVSDSVDILQIF